jgi:predicted ATPase
MAALCNCKILTLTLQHGIAESTSCAFAGYGSTILVFMGQHESVYQFGKLALALCDETMSSPEFIARTLVTVTGHLNH